MTPFLPLGCWPGLTFHPHTAASSASGCRCSLQGGARGSTSALGPPAHGLRPSAPPCCVPCRALCPVRPSDPSLPRLCPAGRRLFTWGPNASGAMWGAVAVPLRQTLHDRRPAACWGGHGPGLSNARSPAGQATWPPWSLDESSNDGVDVEDASPLWLTFLALFLITVVYGGFVTFIKAGDPGRWGPASRARLSEEAAPAPRTGARTRSPGPQGGGGPSSADQGPQMWGPRPLPDPGALAAGEVALGRRRRAPHRQNLASTPPAAPRGQRKEPTLDPTLRPHPLSTTGPSPQPERRAPWCREGVPAGPAAPEPAALAAALLPPHPPSAT